MDRTDLRGSLKIPVRFSDGGEHSLILTYGDKEQPLLFREVVNAEVLDSRIENDSVDLAIRALGRCDVIYSSPEGARLTIDGKPVAAVHRLPEGTFEANLAIVGEHILRLTAGSAP